MNDAVGYTQANTMDRLRLAALLLLLLPVPSVAQEITRIYPGEIPHSRVHQVQEVYERGMYRGVTVPTLEIYLPEKEHATGTGVLICPGGGYSVVVYQGEGVSTARALAANGIAAFVLKYRLPDDATMADKKTGPLQDVQQAIKVIRQNAAKWGVNPGRIGIMGFSAGGHLAATAATQYRTPLIDGDMNTNLRPDFQILVYPVISMQDSLTHVDTRNQLLGHNPTKEIVDRFSNELQVDPNSPPAYLTHAADDNLVDVDHSIRYFEALRHHEVPVEMHIYPSGGHGFIFIHEGWMEPLLAWMKNLE